MFSLHETTKIRLCRAAFLALCAAPLGLVLSWCVVVRTDWYRQSHEQALANALGWQVRLEEVSTPRPHLLLYRGLELADPNGGVALARLPYLEVETQDDVTAVRLPYPAIVNGTRLDAFWKVVQDLARAPAGTPRLIFEATNLTVYLEEGDQSFTDLLGELGGTEGQSLGKLSFRRALAGGGATDTAELLFTRTQHAGTLAHSIDLATGATPMPVSLIAAIWPGAAQLGTTCVFAGRVSTREQAGQWRTELRGELAEIDLDRLVQPFPHKLSGLGTARLDRVTIVGGQLESAAGNLTAGPGEISRSLVQSAERHLRVRVADHAAQGPSNSLPYAQLCVGFELGPRGMTLRGAVPRTKGALLVDERYVLAEEADISSQPLVDLVRTLVPHSDVQVPATKETVRLTSALQMPPVVTEPGYEEPVIQARPLRVAAPPTAGPRRQWPPTPWTPRK